MDNRLTQQKDTRYVMPRIYTPLNHLSQTRKRKKTESSCNSNLTNDQAFPPIEVLNMLQKVVTDKVIAKNSLHSNQLWYMV